MKINYITTVFFTLSLLTFFFSSFLNAEIYLGERFDNQNDWNPTVCDGKDPERIPPPPWEYVLCDTNLYINSSAAHGGLGKGFGIDWSPGMNEVGLHAPTSVHAGKSELWIGFWFKHSLWDWGGDKTYKWFRFGAEGDTLNLNYDKNHRIILRNGDLMKSSIAFDVNDTGWHYFIIYLKHNTIGNSDGELRLWRDGTETVWSFPSAHTTIDNRHIDFYSGSSTFPNAFNLTWGFQSRPDWGTGNKSYFDDIIIASTRAEVEDFLGEPTTSEPPSESPLDDVQELKIESVSP